MLLCSHSHPYSNQIPIPVGILRELTFPCTPLHMTSIIVSEMTYSVSSGTLNPTIPNHCPIESSDVYVLSVAARQAAKSKKLETESQSTADVKSNTAVSNDTKSKDSSTQSLTAEDDSKPEFSYKLPATLEGIPNLPPSVLPPAADAFVGELPEWG